MEDSPLARLPKELRDEIFAYALHFEEGIGIVIRNDLPYLKLPHPSSYPLALTQVCKIVRKESLSDFYSNNVFRIRPFPGDSRSGEIIERWLKQIGYANRSIIRQVDIELGLWTPGYTRPSSATRFATPLPVQAAQYINRLRSFRVPSTFSIDIRYSDIPGLGSFSLIEVDLVHEEKVFGTSDSVFEQACLQQAKIIEVASAESKLESYAVIRLMMGLDRCRSSFAEFLDTIRDRVER